MGLKFHDDADSEKSDNSDLLGSKGSPPVGFAVVDADADEQEQMDILAKSASALYRSYSDAAESGKEKDIDAFVDMLKAAVSTLPPTVVASLISIGISAIYKLGGPKNE